MRNSVAAALCAALLLSGAVCRSEAAECRGAFGTVSHYGFESCSNPGCLMANERRLNPDAMTAAMPSRKHLGERWRVSYAGKSIVVTITDVGPRADLRRLMDLTTGAFSKLARPSRGLIKACIERIN